MNIRDVRVFVDTNSECGHESCIEEDRRQFEEWSRPITEEEILALGYEIEQHPL